VPGLTLCLQGEAQYNWTAHRARGYKVGSLHQGPDEPDKYWTQPGHPLNPRTNEGGRFKVRLRREGHP
jgi:hypothetical protein